MKKTHRVRLVGQQRRRKPVNLKQSIEVSHLDSKQKKWWIMMLPFLSVREKKQLNDILHADNIAILKKIVKEEDHVFNSKTKNV